MEIGGVSASLVSSISNTATQNGDAVTVAVLKEALDTQASSAAQLIESVPSPAQGNLGQNVDVRA